MVAFLFWVSLALVIYAYIGYPIQLLLQARLFPKPIAKANPGEFTPTVSVVVAARNEEKNIARRICNLLEQDYPKELLEVIIVSDGSNDGTERVVSETIRNISDSGRGPKVRLISYGASKGKPFALNKGVAAATGEIIVFADARQSFKTDVLRNLVANFQDSNIGCVSGELIFFEASDSDIQAEAGAYWKYEKLIRKLESRTGSVVGATGAIYAIRKELFAPLQESTILDDVVTPMTVASQGQRVVFEPTGIAFDHVAKDVEKEFSRKVRTLAGNWQLIGQHGFFLMPGGHPLWLRFWAHKVMRLMVPFLLPIILVTSFWQTSPIGVVFGWLQVACYGAALLAAIFTQLRQIRIVGLCFFFMVLNTAAVMGFFYWITGRHRYLWRPTV